MANKLELIGDTTFFTGATVAMPSILIEAFLKGDQHLELFQYGGIAAMVLGTISVLASMIIEERSVNQSYSQIQGLLEDVRERNLYQERKDFIYKIHSGDK